MLVKYDYSKDGIITSEEALRRLCNSDLIDSLQSMYEMDGDMWISTYNTLIGYMYTLMRIKESIDNGGEVIDNDE
jgi:lantibiotic modifying enzyme